MSIKVIPQAGWLWCARCHGLVNSSEAGYCPGKGAPQSMVELESGKPHDTASSGAYTVLMTDAAITGEAGWRWCSVCSVLHREGQTSVCYQQPTDWPVPLSSSGQVTPAGLKPHSTSGSGAYVLLTSAHTNQGQVGWRQCTKCASLFHSGGPGACPVGGNHMGGTTEYCVAHAN